MFSSLLGSQQPPPPPPSAMTSPRPLGSASLLMSGPSESLYSVSTMSDFQIETLQRSPANRRTQSLSDRGYEETLAYRDHSSRFIAAKNQPFSVSGRITLDPSQLVLFFRSKSGIAHFLDFPIDVEYNTLPSVDALRAACRPHQHLRDVDDGYSGSTESFFYPPNFPLSTTFDIASHPILDAVRSTLFPRLPPEHHLTAMRDKLELVFSGGRMGTQPRSIRNDGRSATIIITLPSRFHGGALVLRDPREPEFEETYSGRNGKNGDIEWTAFLPDCEYEVEMVQRGCRVSISYAVFLRTFDAVATGIDVPDPLIHPSDKLLDLLAPILNMSRGRKIGFYLTYDYDVNPAEAEADTLVPMLKAGDALLHHCIRLYKLTPELHWTAGGYIWPIDRVVDFANDPEGQVAGRDPIPPMSSATMKDRTQTPATRTGVLPTGDVPPMRGPFANTYPVESASGASSAKMEYLRTRVEANGALSLTDANVSILLDWNDATGNQLIGKQRVYFMSGGEMEKLVVNVLLVAYVP